MIIVANRIPVNPDYSQQFEETFSKRGGQVDQQAGFIAFQLLRPTKEGDPYIVQTMWESRAAFEAWTQSEAFRQEHGRAGSLPKEAFAGRPDLEIHEVLQATDAVTD